MRLSAWIQGCAAGLFALGLACGPSGSAGQGAEKRAEAPKPADATPEESDAAASAEPGEVAAATAGADAADSGADAALPGAAGKLLKWLDPEAVGVTWIGGAHDLDAQAMVTLFAIPPRAARMLRDNQLVDDGLALLFGADGTADGIREKLRPETLVMQPAVARGTYVLRLLAAPRATIEADLEAHEMQASDVEGYALWEPDGSFPWRVLFLDDETIAMIPVSEMGSGIGPLTAARDLPASDLEKEFGKALATGPDLLFELFAQGPFLHMDLTDDVGVVRLSVRRWQGSGLDANVLLQPLGEPATAADELEARDGALETDAMRQLIDRIAFTAEPPVVLGRLQLPAEDQGPLRRAR